MPETGLVAEKSRISKIHLGRVYNLGNYENMRVEVTVDIGTQDDPATVLRSVENILADLRAKGGVSEWDLSRARATLEKPESELDELERKNLPAYREKLRKVDEAMKRREAARAALATLNYTSEHRDAKDEWEDEDY